MPVVTKWENLHDATLKHISVEWREGTCEATLVLSSTPPCLASIKATSLCKLIVPRAEPWGPSVSVNWAGLQLQDDGHLYTLEIEMQSGDTISMQARFIEIRYELYCKTGT